MLGSLVDNILGYATSAAHKHAWVTLANKVEHLMNAAVDRWRREDFSVYDDKEDNSTVRLKHFMEEAQRHDVKLRPLTVTSQWLNLTADMERGKESVKSARRPDLRVSAGLEGGVSIECKRLLEKPVKWCKWYVNEGLARFAQGEYGSGERLGIQVGFIQAGDLDRILIKVNKAVDNHPSMSSFSTIVLSSTVGSATWLSCRCERGPQAPIDVRHVWIDMRSRQVLHP